MGCIGVDAIIDYLLDPLSMSLTDEDPYVRKSAAICVAKVFEMNQQKVMDNRLIEKL